ncbi:heparinase II/III family protein [Halomonas piscis]|uniref:heparinase II/III family protein n=1 Tax=Halomonas piscis TaxID=3031727 RepID=UPI0028A2411D|nr:heparinase II/III family protein [Halomonas piscis]
MLKADVFNMRLKSGGSHELKCCIAKRLNKIISSSLNESLGEKLFADKKLELSPFQAVDFLGWGRWEQDPLGNRSWQWRLNWLSFLSYLMAYQYSSKNNEVIDFSREAIESWLNTYRDTDTSYPFEFIWHDHATALRAEQLVLFTYYCHEHAPEWANEHGEFLDYLEQSLVVHGQWLAKESFYSEHTNHGLEQARVLLLLGTVFEGALAREWQKVAIRRISSELEFSFTSEGVHVENSPAYHIFVFKVFSGIIKDYPAEVLGDLAEQFDQFSVKALNFITHILRPDGKLPPIGDTEQLPTSDAYREMFCHMPEYQHLRYALTKGKQGEVPPKLNRVYPRSGYAIFRDRWPDAAGYHLALHLIAKVGCSSRYHHQQDEGHISLYAGGEDWLIDSGMYNYINKDPVRRYMRGRAGHNVPLISHSAYEHDFEHRKNAWKVTEHSEAKAGPGLSMKLDVLRPVTQVRSVSMDAENLAVMVSDSFSSDDDEVRNITLQWHIPKNKTIRIEGQGAMVESPNGNRMLIEIDGPKPDNINLTRGVQGGKVFSFISYKANHYEESQLLSIVYKGCRSLEVNTRFTLQLLGR